MISKAKERYFVRDPECNIVYCPSGETLRKCFVEPNENIKCRNNQKHLKFF